MKLSEAMMLGSVTCEMKAADLNVCALGAAANAVGLPKKEDCYFGNRLHVISNRWPWIRETSNGKHGHSDEYVSRFGGNPRESSWAEQIFYRFDRSVVWERSMSLEQLVDYVRSIEPTCGECNRFECTCAPEESTAKEQPCSAVA